MTIFHSKGAFLVNAGAASPSLLYAGGIKRVATQINVHGSDNASTAANVAGLAGTKSSMPFAIHGGWGVVGPDVSADVTLAVKRILEHDLKFYIADTELYWLAGWNVTDMTTRLVEGLRASLGVAFPLAVVSFGYAPSGFPGATLNSGAAVCRRLAVDFIPEGYDFSGVSYGMENVLPYLERDGIPEPPLVAIGDKTVERDTDYLTGHEQSQPVSGVWSWATEQTGTTITRLKTVPLAPASAPLPTTPTSTMPTNAEVAAAKAAMIQHIDQAGEVGMSIIRRWENAKVTQATINGTKIKRAIAPLVEAREILL